MSNEIADLALARRLVASGAARTIREGAGLSRAEAAKAAGCSAAAVVAWEGGRRRPKGDRGAAYGRFLRQAMAGDFGSGEVAS